MKTFSDNIHLDEVIKEERRVRAEGGRREQNRGEGRIGYLGRHMPATAAK